MLDLNTPVQFLKGVGPKAAVKLTRLGIETIRDLLFYYPRNYQDYTLYQSIATLRLKEEVIIKAEIEKIMAIKTKRKQMSLVEATLKDDSGAIRAVWFNQPYLLSTLKVGQVWYFSGKVSWDFQKKEKTFSPISFEEKPVVLAIYPETEGLTSKYLRKIIKPLILEIDKLNSDYLPSNILKSNNLINLNEALIKIHFPNQINDILPAKKRLAFDELFLISLRTLSTKSELQKNVAPPVKVDEELLRRFSKSLPFKLTNAQRKAAWEIIKDLARPIPMNRLLEGDVGSGKTVVACFAALLAIKNGYRVVWLAPTEILASQHFINVSKLLADFKIRLGLLTANRHELNHQITSKKQDSQFIIDSSDLIIGTHALIQKGIEIPNLGFIIIDEQHRFGVKQRAYLRKQSVNDGRLTVPHLLSMTATPIPRTLALGLYGDLDLSIIDEMPANRKPIETKVVQPKDRSNAYEFIRSEVKAGRQVYVVCPLIELKETNHLNLFDTDRKAVMDEYTKLSEKVFPEFKVAFLHGKMKPKEKNEVMADFTAGKIEILVSTAVVEVGIDVANATVMMIESAERFGLAQLHQFRGRVGRGKYQSYCFLLAESWSEVTAKRLSAMSHSNNGFELAQIDLEIRGPGELSGLRQSGLADLKIASLSDIAMVNSARQAAEEIVKLGLENYSALKDKILQFENAKHLE